MTNSDWESCANCADVKRTLSPKDWEKQVSRMPELHEALHMPHGEENQQKEPEEALKDLISDWSETFDQLCQERHLAGAKEYGVFTFLGNDIVRMMMEELADTANYCRMQFIKLMMLQAQLEGDPRVMKSDMGAQAFKGVGEVGWKK